jgi:tRNA-modifying protein YgfZ
LTMYRLRSKATIEDISDTMNVYADLLVTESTGCADPRLPILGARVIASNREAEDGAVYSAYCLNLGIPDPAVDLLVEKDFIMEGIFDELNGLDHHKGCYVGQEMTSRMKRRTSVKNKLCRVRYEGPAPEFETPILADGWEVGRMRSGIVGVGIALIRFDRARKAISEGKLLLAGKVPLTLDPPDWLIEPDVQI